jgi:hypothetical protein
MKPDFSTESPHSSPAQPRAILAARSKASLLHLSYMYVISPLHPPAPLADTFTRATATTSTLPSAAPPMDKLR